MSISKLLLVVWGGYHQKNILHGCVDPYLVLSLRIWYALNTIDYKSNSSYGAEIKILGCSDMNLPRGWSRQENSGLYSTPFVFLKYLRHFLFHHARKNQIQ
mmetsp:Transcript_43122/g.90267  ORF Transcript_43122/g.90267 Transcript_43122/m.90267 type:complete len:101 (+) Transcript_43122:777-1079(+)